MNIEINIGEIEKSRVFGLDLLRAYAILCVVYAHGYGYIKDSISEYAYNLPITDGVTLFFVLSGFLIGRILLKAISHEKFSLRLLINFWLRRWFRTLPSYFLVLIFLIFAWRYKVGPLPNGWLDYFCFCQNFMSPQIDFFSESWSLSVEEWFYFIVPLLLFFLLGYVKISDKKAAFMVIAILIIFVTLIRWYHSYKFGYSDINSWDANLRKLVVTRMDSIMYGVFGAFLSLYHASLWKRYSLRLLLIGVLIFVIGKYYAEPTDRIYLNYFYLTITPIATLMLLPALSEMRVQGGIFIRLITFISVISYSMYLLNLSPVQGSILPFVVDLGSALFGQQLFKSGYAMYTLYWGLTLFLSFLLTSFFERPITSLRDRFTT